ncbi:hypothetical protein [Ktedonospora formicarum]|uniref:hypothetical protein n=1 Tax=Ktedonospora formicarum TaxID=2778364 RepID=UPI001F1B1215|nr:hypothetical protein [Ktedonospora formicarum]
MAIAGALFGALGGSAAGRLLSSNNIAEEQLLALQQTFTNAFQVTFIVCACIAALGIFASLVRGKEERSAI